MTRRRLTLRVEEFEGVPDEGPGRIAAAILFTSGGAVTEVFWRSRGFEHVLTLQRARELYWCRVQGQRVRAEDKEWPTCHVNGLPCSTPERRWPSHTYDQAEVTVELRAPSGKGVH